MARALSVVLSSYARCTATPLTICSRLMSPLIFGSVRMLSDDHDVTPCPCPWCGMENDRQPVVPTLPRTAMSASVCTAPTSWSATVSRS